MDCSVLSKDMFITVVFIFYEKHVCRNMTLKFGNSLDTFRKHWHAAWFQRITQRNCVYMRISDQAGKRIDITSIVLLIKPEHAIFGITVP